MNQDEHHPDTAADADAVAVLIGFIGLMLALLGLQGMLSPGWLSLGVCWAFAGLGLSTIALGVVLLRATRN